MHDETITVQGIPVRVQGQGPGTLILLHGWPDTEQLWDAQVQALAPHWRCVRFTLPGYLPGQPRRAYSLQEVVDLLHAVVARVSPDVPVNLLLHDWGCIFGYHYIAQHRERVARVIGVDVGDIGSPAYRASLDFKARFGIFAYQIWLAAAWVLGGRLGDVMTRSMARWLRCRSDPAPMGAQMNYPYFIQWSGMHGSYRALQPFEPHGPMLYLYGRRKPFMFHSQAWLQRLQARPGCAVLGLDCGHWVMSARPEAFNEAVLGWLAQG